MSIWQDVRFDWYLARDTADECMAMAKACADIGADMHATNTTVTTDWTGQAKDHFDRAVARKLTELADAEAACRSLAHRLYVAATAAEHEQHVREAEREAHRLRERQRALNRAQAT